MRFFSKQSPANIAATYLAPPNGLSISLATTRNGHQRRYGPGTIIHGQVNLILTKPILRPCQLRVVFTCTSTIEQEQQQDGTSSTILFEVDHLLIDNQTLPSCGRQAPLHFCIKLPLCNYPPSMEEGDRSVSYTLQAVLSFEADLGTNNGSTTTVHTSTSSPAVKILYVPHVSHAAAAALVTTNGGSSSSQQSRPVVVANAAAVATNSCRWTEGSSSSSNAPVHETSGSLMVDSRSSSGLKAINASVQSDHAAMILRVENNSDITLQAVRLALVRQISFPSSSSSNFHAVPGSVNSTSYTNPISTTVHAATIPVAKVSNRDSTWSQQLQFRVPSNLNLLPSINKSITPLLKVDYFIVLSIPIPQRQGGFVSRLTSSARKRSSIDLSIFHSRSSSLPSPSMNETTHLFSTSPPAATFDAQTAFKTPTVLQLAPIPITLTSVPSYTDGRKYSRPIPHHLEVEDRPTFVRDRFEEEMIQQLSSLESLVMDNGDDDDLDIDLLVEEARRRRLRRSGSDGSSEDSDEDDEEGEEEDDPRMVSRVPARFRQPYRNSSLPISSSGLDTPPPSPPYLAKAMSDDAMMIQTMRERSFARNMAISNSNSPPNTSAGGGLGLVLGRSTLGSKSCGLSKDLLMDLHQSRGQQPRPSI
ncbi:hypothetical protein BGX33_008664 [Mortierella sp. NVP41]|nr:hypothetical protein BGX33_008664 [Mortierella sp. NVP41]